MLEDPDRAAMGLCDVLNTQSLSRRPYVYGYSVPL